MAWHVPHRRCEVMRAGADIRPSVTLEVAHEAEGRKMKSRMLAVVAMATLLVLAMFAGPALAQEPEVPDEIPEGMELEEFVETYIPAEVEEVVIEAEPEPEPEVEVLAEVRERLPVTGGDLLGLAIIGLVLLALGFFAVRRGRSRPSAQKG